MISKQKNNSEEHQWYKFLKTQFPLPVLMGEMSYYQEGVFIVPEDNFHIMGKDLKPIETLPNNKIWSNDDFSKDVLDLLNKYRLHKRDIIGCENNVELKMILFKLFQEKYDGFEFLESSTLEFLKFKQKCSTYEYI